ncbi:YusW family protein [Psychrobacillus sp. FSL K6-2836]|uniref:YusW family protein n=1 Tax=Psychrobacillus sp. FSL K6-2836 TaxID=2921548 RepID=UPI0030F51ECA
MHAASSLKGDAAYALLQPIFLELQPMKDMSDEEVIQRVASAFEVDEYTKVDLKIEYEDGETKTYTDEN